MKWKVGGGEEGSESMKSLGSIYIHIYIHIYICISATITVSQREERT